MITSSGHLQMIYFFLNSSNSVPETACNNLQLYHFLKLIAGVTTGQLNCQAPDTYPKPRTKISKIKNNQ